MGIAIVAVPEQQDPVWKYSSEKIPHMTLLYLGDPGPDFDEAHAAQYIQHIAENSMEPFWMSVDRRGVLGPDNADVLFFSKDFMEKKIEEVRSYLLKDDDLAKAFQAASTYPEWIPHLTMGYPTAPAKKDDRDYPGFGTVHFDQLAFWTGDFDGPTFQLTHPERGNEVMPSVMWSEKTENFLEHYGILGMHWGVRRRTDTSSGSEGSVSKAPVKTKPVKLTGKQVRAEKKQFYIDKADKIVKESLKDPDVLIRIQQPGKVPAVVTGRELVAHLAKGGYMNTRMTDIYAKKENGTYVIQEGEKFVRSDRKKS